MKRSKMTYIQKTFTNGILLFIVLFSISCSDDSNETPRIGGPTPLVTAEISVDPFIEYQNIRGFGGINHPVWRSDMNAQAREKVFGNGPGQLGFSILRLHIDPDANRWESELPTAQYAASKGAIIFASPWDAPPALLDPNSTNVDKILPENYGAYVNHLNEFNTYMGDNGVPLYAISVQNEPDIGEWTQWAPDEMLKFMKENAQDIENKVIAPESFQFRKNYSDPILNDPIANENIDIVGGHIYGGGLENYPLALEKGKEIWMTEYLMNLDATASWSQLEDSVIWDESMAMLSTIHQSMLNHWNAYVWWYIQRYYSFIGDGDQGTVSGEILKRGYAFSHYSKFVRPGYFRVGVDIKQDKELVATAYTGDNKTVIVIINPSANEVKGIGAMVDNTVPAAATLYTTSLTKNIEETTLAKQDEKLLFDMPAKSVATLVIQN